MANSQNNWPVASQGQMDREPLIRDVKVPNGVLAGDVAVVFRWLAAQYDRRVERLDPKECWGWYVKKIEGSSTISNHASGTAVDFNAPDNPMGSGTTKRSLSAAQINTCHRLEEESGGVLRWGGDFSRNDPMHWEIVASRSAVKTFANKIRNETKGFDVAGMSQAEFNTMLVTGLKAADDVDPLATLLRRTDATTNRDVPAIEKKVTEVQAELAEVKTTLAQILGLLQAPGGEGA